VEPFSGAIAIFFRGQRHGFRTFRCYLHVASQSLTPLSCAYNFFRLISVLQNMYYDAWPDYLISSIRTVCKYRKCSFLTGLITSLTDLVQAYHQGQIGTSKTKSTGSPFHIPITLLSEFFCFALTESFSVLAESLFAGYLEVHQKYSTARHIFKSLLSVQKCGQT